MLKIYEAKFEIDRDEESVVASEFSFMFLREYWDEDIYLKTKRRDSFKFKVSEDGTIWYHVKLVDGIFEITGQAITPAEQKEILKLHPVEIEMRRLNRAYEWKQFMVKCDFDYIEHFPTRAFLKVYSVSRAPVEEARKFLLDNGVRDTVELAYNKLYQQQKSYLS